MFLRCRHAAKSRFMKLRADVQVKLQLLDNKRGMSILCFFLFLSCVSLSSFSVQDLAFQLERLVAGLYVYSRQCHKIFKPAAVFPIEVELGVELLPPPSVEEEEVVEVAEKEAKDDEGSTAAVTNGDATADDIEKENIREEPENEGDKDEKGVIEGNLISLD